MSIEIVTEHDIVTDLLKVTVGTVFFRCDAAWLGMASDSQRNDLIELLAKQEGDGERFFWYEGEPANYTLKMSDEPGPVPDGN